MYKTGELSKLFDIDRTSLNHYVRIGLLRPVVLENQYHEYSFFDLLALSYIRYYRGLGFELNQIKELIHSTNHEEKQVFFQNRTDEIDQQIKLLQMQKSFLGHLNESVRLINKYSNQPVITTTKGYYFIRKQDIVDPALKDLYKLIPSNEFEVDYDEDYNAHIKQAKTSQGLGLKEEWVKEFGITIPENAIYYPPEKKCIVTWRIPKENSIEHIKTGLKEIEKFCFEHSYEMSHTFVLHLLINNYSAEDMYVDAFAQFTVNPIEE